MSSLEKRHITFNTIIEVNDESKEFIPYWNLTTKEHLNNNFVTIETETNKSGIISLNSFNFKLIDSKELPDQINNSNTIQLDKFFTIDVYRIKKEKDFNNDFIKLMKQNYNINNVSVVLYNFDDVKDNSIKNIGKIVEKIKTKTGIADFSFVPYNEQYYTKFYSIVDSFFMSLKRKITIEYNNQLKALLDKINSSGIIYNTEIIERAYDYITNKILYLDLLIIGEFWEEIKRVCISDVFKVFSILNNKLTTIDGSSDINVAEFKQKVKNKKITNIEYQIYLINCFMKSCRHLKDYNGLIKILFDSGRKLNIYKDCFESDYHYYYWIINYILHLVSYLTTFEEKLSTNDTEGKNTIRQGIIFLYSLCIKYMKQYAKLFKYEIPTNKIFIQLKNWVDNGNNIKEELEKNYISNNFEPSENIEAFDKFKTEIKSIDNFYFDMIKSVYDIFTNKKSFLEEYLNILQIINKNHCNIYKCSNSIRNYFEIIPVLVSLNKFEEAKNILNNLIQEKVYIKKELKTLYEFICLLLVMLLYSSEKNNDNLKLMLKLFDTNISNMKLFLLKFEYKDENLINDIISKFIEKYSDIEEKNEINDKLNKIFYLDKTININLEQKKDNMIFINKQKMNKEEIKYTITNNTGISFNINKIQLIFEEFNLIKNKEEKKEIIYEINNDTNNFKCIEPYIKSQENVFLIELNENNDIFKMNTTYKFKQIKYIINNSLCGIYNIKQDLKICFNSIEMKVSTQIFPSFDSSEFSLSSRNVFYYNTLSKINIDLIDLPSDDLLQNKILKINLEDMSKKDDTKLIIQNLILKEELIKLYPDVIIDDYSIEFPPNSLKGKEKNNINILVPFYIENTNFYDNGTICIKIKVEIVEQSDKEKIFYSFSSFHNINLIHLFNIRKKFRFIKNNSLLMQATFSLNIEVTNMIVYTHNSDNFSFNMDTTQAINLVLLLGNQEEDIIKKLRQNFLEFSLDDIINNEKKIIKYRLCFPERNILDEIKELKEIPYYIKISVEEKTNDIFKELSVNINIKKNNKKKVLLLIHICDNENWAVIGKSKLIEEWYNDKDNKEKNLKIKLLRLVDGFLKIPEIEFMEYEITENKDDILKINENDEKKDEFTIGKMNFEPIEYGTIIEGNEKVVNITPAKECTLKLNLT